MTTTRAKLHSHYFKDVSHLSKIDVYRVLSLFEVKDPCIQHAVKKLLVPGNRGAGKTVEQDIQEAIDSLHRSLDMRSEDSPERAIQIPLPEQRSKTNQDFFDFAVCVGKLQEKLRSASDGEVVSIRVSPQAYDWLRSTQDSDRRPFQMTICGVDINR